MPWNILIILYLIKYLLNMGIVYVPLELDEDVHLILFVIYVSAERSWTLCHTLSSRWTYKLLLTLAGSLNTVVDVTCSISLSVNITVTAGRIRHSCSTLSYTFIDSQRRVIYKFLKLMSNILGRFTERNRTSHFTARLGTTVYVPSSVSTQTAKYSLLQVRDHINF
jgi:hypothetical protein